MTRQVSRWVIELQKKMLRVVLDKQCKEREKHAGLWQASVSFKVLLSLSVWYLIPNLRCLGRMWKCISNNSNNEAKSSVVEFLCLSINEGPSFHAEDFLSLKMIWTTNKTQPASSEITIILTDLISTNKVHDYKDRTMLKFHSIMISLTDSDSKPVRSDGWLLCRNIALPE